jgi:CheY-like chemotaxis protein
MGRFLAVNGALFVLGGLIVLPLAFSAASRCYGCLLRNIKGFFAAVTGQQAGLQAAWRKTSLEQRVLGNSALHGKSILMVDDKPGVLEMLEAEIRRACPSCRLQKAATYGEATMLIASWTYDLLVFDITGVRGFDMLTQAVDRPYPIPAVMLNAEALPPALLDKALALGGLPCLPGERLRQIVPFLDDVMKFKHETAWGRLLHPVRRRVSLAFRFTEGRYSEVAAR